MGPQLREFDSVLWGKLRKSNFLKFPPVTRMHGQFEETMPRIATRDTVRMGEDKRPGEKRVE